MGKMGILKAMFLLSVCQGDADIASLRSWHFSPLVYHYGLRGKATVTGFGVLFLTLAL